MPLREHAPFRVSSAKDVHFMARHKRKHSELLPEVPAARSVLFIQTPRMHTSALCKELASLRAQHLDNLLLDITSV